MYKILWLISLLNIPFLTKALPIDLYNPDSANLPDFRMAKTDTGPGICKENLNNDNVTNIKWYRYHNETHKCWHIDERGPCGKMMLFYPIGDTEFGDCDCNFYYRCARPLIYWEKSNRCYYTNDQGPCTKDEWFVLDDNLKPKCQLNPCTYNQTLEPSTYDRYWFGKEGHCYVTLTQGYCDNPQEILYSKWEDYKPSCNIGRSCTGSGRNPKTEIMPCLPGQKHDLLGNCRKPLRVNNWFPVSIFK